MVGTGRAAELGVLFRQGDALQSLQGVEVVAFDKTGTLTEGHPVLTGIETVYGVDEDELLRITASVEAQSEHPIAQAILRRAKERDLTLSEVRDFDTITGFGLRATVEDREVLIGAARLMAREGIDHSGFAALNAAYGEAGQTPLFIAIDGRMAGVMSVADPLRKGAIDAVRALHDMGVEVAMITGDTKATAQSIASALQIDHVVAEVLPEGKVDAVNSLKEGGRMVAFVGDGINDAPALATADVGIAIGTGTDVAIEAADVVLMSGATGGVVSAFEVSRRTMSNIRQNLGWAFGYNVLLIPVAAGLLYPFFGIMLSPMLAAGAMALSSVFVLTNALRLRRVAAPITAPDATESRRSVAVAPRPRPAE